MIPVAGLLGLLPRGSPAARVATGFAIVLTVAGGGVMLLFQGVGARIPHDVPDPLVDVVWPLWRGDPLPPWWIGKRFGHNLVSLAVPSWIARLSPRWQSIQFLPLVLAQGLVMVALGRFRSTSHDDKASPHAGTLKAPSHVESTEGSGSRQDSVSP
jgi:hypothetical protein